MEKVAFDTEGWPLCPDCGERLRFVETEGHDKPSGLWDVPPSYIIDYWIYECPECGLTIKSEKEL